MDYREQMRPDLAGNAPDWVEKLPRVLTKRRIPISLFAVIGILTVAGACLAAVTAVVVYSCTAMRTAHLCMKWHFRVRTNKARILFSMLNSKAISITDKHSMRAILLQAVHKINLRGRGYRTATHELTGEEDQKSVALSSLFQGGMPSRLRLRSKGRRVFCVYNNRLPERQPAINFTIEDLKVQYCDDIVYGYVGLDGTATNIRSKHPKYDFLDDGLKRFVGLKRLKPELNLWACLGGSTEDGPRFATLVKERRTRMTFVQNSADWLRRNAFQGLLLYWKHPGPEHRVNFSVLLADLRNAYARDNLLVSVVLPLNTRLRRDSYYVQSIYETLDVVLVDGHRSVDPRHFPFTTCASPLRTLLRAWHQGQYGLQRSIDDIALETDDFRKTVLSVSFAGVSFTLRHRNLHRVGAAVAGPGAPGERTNESGLLSYVEVQERLLKEGWKRSYHHYGRCPFARKELQWVAYEDEESLGDKAGLAEVCSGLAVWDADMDDFTGLLGKPCPLLRKVHEAVHQGTSHHKTPSQPKSYRQFF